MARSFHVTRRQQQIDAYLNRTDDGGHSPGLSRLDELSLRKSAAKETEAFRRAAANAGGLRYAKFVFTEHGWVVRKQKCRGALSELPAGGGEATANRSA